MYSDETECIYTCAEKLKDQKKKKNKKICTAFLSVWTGTMIASVEFCLKWSDAWGVSVLTTALKEICKHVMQNREFYETLLQYNNFPMQKKKKS